MRRNDFSAEAKSASAPSPQRSLRLHVARINDCATTSPCKGSGKYARVVDTRSGAGIRYRDSCIATTKSQASRVPPELRLRGRVSRTLRRSATFSGCYTTQRQRRVGVRAQTALRRDVRVFQGDLGAGEGAVGIGHAAAPQASRLRRRGERAGSVVSSSRVSGIPSRLAASRID